MTQDGKLPGSVFWFLHGLSAYLVAAALWIAFATGLDALWLGCFAVVSALAMTVFVGIQHSQSSPPSQPKHVYWTVVLLAAAIVASAPLIALLAQYSPTDILGLFDYLPTVVTYITLLAACCYAVIACTLKLLARQLATEKQATLR